MGNVLPHVAVIVAEGHKSLANRVLQLLDEIDPILIGVADNPISGLEQIREIAQTVAITGDIRPFGDLARADLYFTPITITDAIPNSYKPKSKFETVSDAALGLHAFKPINERYGFVSPEELLRYVGIRGIGNIEFTSFQGGATAIFQADSEDSEWILEYDPEHPLLSVFSNIHELSHGLQEVFRTIHSIMGDLRVMPGVAAMMDTIWDDANLKQRLLEFTFSTHQLHFLRSRYIMDIAWNSGVDMVKYERFLDEFIPLFDYLYCFMEGDAHLTTWDVVESHPRYNDDGLIARLCTLAVGLDALRAPLKSPKPIIYYVGVGMVQFMRDNPKLAEHMVQSTEFHQELSGVYFP
ncbi:MAG: hypothetical protein ABIG95_01900 [Candidatus Woesearchaeota archaeon]